MAARIDHKKEINGVLYLTAAIILAVAYYLPSVRTGWLGSVLLSGGRGLFGIAALGLPAVFLYMAIDYLLEKKLSITRLRFTYVFILLVAIAALMQTITIELGDVRRLSQNEQGEAQAFIALQTLWHLGIDPVLIGSESMLLPGGLLGGILALAMTLIAGPTGSIVLLAALILSMLVLLFNVSVSHAVGQTAKAIQHTHKKVDQAVRTSVTTMRQNRQNDLDPKSYDMKVEDDENADTDKDSTDQQIYLEDFEKSADKSGKTGWREQLRRLWSPDARGESETIDPIEDKEDLSVPGFLTGETDSQPEADDKSGLVTETEENEAGFRQQSAYDLKLKDPDWIMSPADQSELPDIPTIGHQAQQPPAGVHRVGQPDEANHKSSWNIGEDTDNKISGADPISADQDDLQSEADRSSWIDRSEDPSTDDAAAEPAESLKKSKHAGQQVDIPWQPPSLQLLTRDQGPRTLSSNLEINRLGKKLEQTLESFGVTAHVIRHSTGPTITRFELAPGPGVKVSRIVSLADDIALNLAATGVRIEAPIPGKAAIGIEVPNKETTPVLLRGLLESPEYRQSKDPLTVAIGRDIQGRPILTDLTRMPHLLIAGATGSGKSVCINAILMSILFKSSPEDVKLMMIDPKVVELNVYNGIPHLITPVVTDPKKAANALVWAVNEMSRRYGLFAEKSVRDIKAYQAAAERDGDDEFEHLPLILLVIDELSDLMATTPTEVEDAIARLTAMARAAGIHLIIATQRPSVDVITGVIKANIPSRIAFAVASQVDSRTILDTGGAEKLLGKGDMLYYPQSAAKPIRGQGAFISDPEVERVLRFIKGQHQAEYDDTVTDVIMTPASGSGKERGSSEQDELLFQALALCIESGYASVSLLQRRMNVGYPRAARLIDTLNTMGYVGPFEGSKPRKILITQSQYQELQAKGEAE